MPRKELKIAKTFSCWPGQIPPRLALIEWPFNVIVSMFSANRKALPSHLAHDTFFNLLKVYMYVYVLVGNETFEYLYTRCAAFPTFPSFLSHSARDERNIFPTD